MRETRTERAEGLSLPATAAAKGLGMLPLGSAHSRAAARSLIAARKAIQGEGHFIRVRLVGSPPPPDRKCTCPIPPAGSFSICRCFCEGE